MLTFGSTGGGPCAASPSGHSPRLTVYNLEYNRRPSAREDGGWRYCAKCRALFRPRRRNRGVCAAGGAHGVYAGYRYNLRIA